MRISMAADDDFTVEIFLHVCGKFTQLTSAKNRFSSF